MGSVSELKTAACPATLARRATGAGAGPQRANDRRWLILTVLAAVAFIAQLDLFIVNVAIPTIGHLFAGARLCSLFWVLNGYVIARARSVNRRARLRTAAAGRCAAVVEPEAP